ncbi:hypothetical protein HX13_03635 [Chryseobacterium sp. P1-3]|nr:hypothetical protein HX13_03635 [Chryseobacterium sp. P1-3]
MYIFHSTKHKILIINTLYNYTFKFSIDIKVRKSASLKQYSPSVIPIYLKKIGFFHYFCFLNILSVMTAWDIIFSQDNSFYYKMGLLKKRTEEKILQYYIVMIVSF